MKQALYYNSCNLPLSGREYVVIEAYKDGSKLIEFPTFGGATVTAIPSSLDGSQRASCEKKWEEERMRIAKIHGWSI